ncbi:hypothetical protein cyc_04064 [Cyclospora cayetanensis]|uniref:Uncharacterized protein n=1 Tax=Cyclospora cayetanensis TaxID=88456 RepID=A0A1D3D585_9EIME|nr:hypothetical protein cyc_04064 [Cyclospora cayetanensis]
MPTALTDSRHTQPSAFPPPSLPLRLNLIRRQTGKLRLLDAGCREAPKCGDGLRAAAVAMKLLSQHLLQRFACQRAFFFVLYVLLSEPTQVASLLQQQQQTSAPSRLPAIGRCSTSLTAPRSGALGVITAACTPRSGSAAFLGPPCAFVLPCLETAGRLRGRAVASSLALMARKRETSLSLAALRKESFPEPPQGEEEATVRRRVAASASVEKREAGAPQRSSRGQAAPTARISEKRGFLCNEDLPNHMPTPTASKRQDERRSRTPKKAGHPPPGSLSGGASEKLLAAEKMQPPSGIASQSPPLQQAPRQLSQAVQQTPLPATFREKSGAVRPQQQQQLQQQLHDAPPKQGLLQESLELVSWLRETQHPLEAVLYGGSGGEGGRRERGEGGREVKEGESEAGAAAASPSGSNSKAAFLGSEPAPARGFCDVTRQQAPRRSPSVLELTVQPLIEADTPSVASPRLSSRLAPSVQEAALVESIQRATGKDQDTLLERLVQAPHGDRCLGLKPPSRALPITEKAPFEGSAVCPRHVVRWWICVTLLSDSAHQEVSRWLRFLSPPTATWVLPVPPKGEAVAAEGPFSRRAAGASRLRAPPSTRALSCRVVGWLPQRDAVVVQVLGAEDFWHPASGILGSKVNANSTPLPGASLSLSASAVKVSGEGQGNRHLHDEKTAERPPERLHALPAPAQTPPTDSDHASAYDAARLFQRAERALRLEQQTSRDPLLQEELLVQQEALVQKVLPQKREAELAALQQLLQQHPHLHAYHAHLHSYPDTTQEDAVGALALLPVRELEAFMRVRKDWNVRDDVLRLYFSSVEGLEGPLGRPPVRWRGVSGISCRRDGVPGSQGQPQVDYSALLWLSIYPAVPLEVAHLLLNDMPVPHLAPVLRIYEQRQLAEQHEEHQQLLRHIQRYQDDLAREQATRKRLQEQQGSEDGSEGRSKGDSEPSKQLTGRGNRPSSRKQDGTRPPLHRIPVQPLWWAKGDWLHREVRLCQLLGPFFYRQLLRLRRQEEGAASTSSKYTPLCDPRGKPFEDLTSEARGGQRKDLGENSRKGEGEGREGALAEVMFAVVALSTCPSWVAMPDRLHQLRPSFVRMYTNKLRTALQLLKTSDYPKQGLAAYVSHEQAFARFLATADVSDEVVAARIAKSELPEEVRGLLQAFQLLRRKILDGLRRHGPVGEDAMQGSHTDPTASPRFKKEASPAKVAILKNEGQDGDPGFADFGSGERGRSESPLMQLLRLHSRLRLQLRPQQRAPSLEQWQRQQQQREQYRRSQRRPQQLQLSAAEEEITGAPEDLPQSQLHPLDQDEYDRVDKLADEVGQQLIDSSLVESGAAPNLVGTRPSYSQAYPSGAIRKPRSFYNYMNEEFLPVLETDPDENLIRLAGGLGATTAHELFLPLPLQSQQD